MNTMPDDVKLKPEGSVPPKAITPASAMKFAEARNSTIRVVAISVVGVGLVAALIVSLFVPGDHVKEVAPLVSGALGFIAGVGVKTVTATAN
jgi:hypothetical protein